MPWAKSDTHGRNPRQRPKPENEAKAVFLAPDVQRVGAGARGVVIELDGQYICTP